MNLNQFNYNSGIDFDSNGNIYVADDSNHRVKKIIINPEITIAAGATTGTITFTGIDDSIDESD